MRTSPVGALDAVVAGVELDVLRCAALELLGGERRCRSSRSPARPVHHAAQASSEREPPVGIADEVVLGPGGAQADPVHRDAEHAARRSARMSSRGPGRGCAMRCVQRERCRPSLPAHLRPGPAARSRRARSPRCRWTMPRPRSLPPLSTLFLRSAKPFHLRSGKRLVHHRPRSRPSRTRSRPRSCRDLRRRNHVAAAELRRIHAELARRLSTSRSSAYDIDRPPGAAVRRHRHGVGEREADARIAPPARRRRRERHVDDAERVDERRRSARGRRPGWRA